MILTDEEITAFREKLKNALAEAAGKLSREKLLELEQQLEKRKNS